MITYSVPSMQSERTIAELVKNLGSDAPEWMTAEYVLKCFNGKIQVAWEPKIGDWYLVNYNKFWFEREIHDVIVDIFGHEKISKIISGDECDELRSQIKENGRCVDFYIPDPKTRENIESKLQQGN